MDEKFKKVRGIQYLFSSQKKKKKKKKLYDEIFLKGILPSDAQVVVRSYICTYVVYKARILGLLNQSLLSILRVNLIHIFEPYQKKSKSQPCPELTKNLLVRCYSFLRKIYYFFTQLNIFLSSNI